MKLIFIILITILLGINSLFGQTPSPTPPAETGTFTVTAQDLKTFRQAIADKIYFENRSKQLEASYGTCQSNFDKLTETFRSEQSRADNIQGERINKLEAVIKEKDLRIENYITQANDIRDENLILKSDNKRLRSDRWKIGAISFGVGAGVGGLVSHRYF